MNLLIPNDADIIPESDVIDPRVQETNEDEAERGEEADPEKEGEVDLETEEEVGREEETEAVNDIAQVDIGPEAKPDIDIGQKV